MLLFSSDSLVVNGITVFPDHKDANQFWYLPGPVGLETMDGSTEPQFLLIMYAPDVATSGIQGTGFLNVTLSLKLSDDNHEAILGQIRTQFPNADNPLLSPVSFDDGTVQVVALDLQGSGGTTAPPGNASGVAVEHILGASNPELFGNNDALFALTLSEEGATILEQAFQDGMAPVGGIYNLKFTGVLPALDVKITADLKRVYESFSVDLTAQAYFVSAGIDATFEKLRQDGSIQIEVVNLTTDASGTDRENWALNLFKDQILATWFQPSLGPATEAAADAQSVNIPTRAGTTTGTTTPPPTVTQPPHTTGMGSSGSSSSMTNPQTTTHPTGMSSTGTSSGAASGSGTTASGAGASGSGSGASGGVTPPKPAVSTPPTAPAPPVPAAGGSQSGVSANPLTNALKSLPGTASAASSAASPFSVALRLKFVSQDEQKTVTYEFNQMSAVQRTYAPQGYFGLLLQGIDQSKHFLKVDGTDPFFNHFAITVNPPKDFAGIGLLNAHVAVDYGDPSSQNPVKHNEFAFTPTTATAQTWDVFEGLIQRTQFNYTADYKFDPESGWIGEQTAYTLPTVTTENRVLNLDPYDFLGFLQVSVSADRIDPNLVDRIEVPLQYQATSGWQTSTTIIVKPGGAPQFWKLRLADKNVRTYTYSTNCYLKDGTLISTPQTSSTASAIIVSDPFIGAISLTLQPAFSAATYSMAIVELSYQDTAHNYSFRTTIQIPAGTTNVPGVRIPLIDRSLNSYQYRFTFITTTNQQQQGSYITATDPLVVVIPGS
jgi:hypothetical protein